MEAQLREDSPVSLILKPIGPFVLSAATRHWAEPGYNEDRGPRGEGPGPRAVANRN
jgi:hypothetical protein